MHYWDTENLLRFFFWFNLFEKLFLLSFVRISAMKISYLYLIKLIPRASHGIDTRNIFFSSILTLWIIYIIVWEFLGAVDVNLLIIKLNIAFLISSYFHPKVYKQKRKKENKDECINKKKNLRKKEDTFSASKLQRRDTFVVSFVPVGWWLWRSYRIRTSHM